MSTCHHLCSGHVHSKYSGRRIHRGTRRALHPLATESDHRRCSSTLRGPGCCFQRSRHSPFHSRDRRNYTDRPSTEIPVDRFQGRGDNRWAGRNHHRDRQPAFRQSSPCSTIPACHYRLSRSASAWLPGGEQPESRWPMARQVRGQALRLSAPESAATALRSRGSAPKYRTSGRPPGHLWINVMYAACVVLRLMLMLQQFPPPAVRFMADGLEG